MKLRPRSKQSTQPVDETANAVTKPIHKSKQPAKRSRVAKAKDAASSAQAIELPNPNRLQGKRSRLQYILDVPLDVLLEIFVYLQPNDLLSLARTNKDLRAFLMKKQVAAPCWKAARRNVEGLPACPDDLSEPAYANLLFSSQCHRCLQKNCLAVFWYCRVRLCKGCQYKYISEVPNLELTSYVPVMNKEVKNILQQFKVSSVLGEMQDLPDQFSGYYYKVYLPHSQSLSASIRSLLSDPPALLAHVKHRKEQLTAIQQSSPLLRTWYMKKRAGRSNELDAMRATRQQQIIEKLKLVGWDEEIKLMQYPQSRAFKKLPEMRKTQPLTDRVWNNIAESMVDFMEAAKIERLAILRQQTRKLRVRMLASVVRGLFPPHVQHHPTTPDIVIGIPRVRETIDSVPYETKMNTSAFDWLPGVLAEFADRRLQEGKQYFEGLICSELRLDESSEDPLRLAVAAWFLCDDCSGHYTFPSVLYHDCRADYAREKGHRDDWEEIVRQALNKSPVKLAGYEKGLGMLREAVIAYGLDPRTATAADMDNAPARLVCRSKKCNPWRGGHSANDVREVMDWRVACSNSRRPECEFRQASHTECIAARPLEEVALAAAVKLRDNSYEVACRRCHLRVYKLRLLAHMQQKHNIVGLSEADWYDVPNSVISPSSVYLFSKTLQGSLKPNDLIMDFMHRGIAAYVDFAEGSGKAVGPA